MNETPNQPADGAEVREQLVAYLDGELTPAEAREIERRLAREPEVQRELQQLQQAWDLLDRLPRAELGADFTRSTVEMIAVAAEEEAEPPAAPRAIRRAWLWKAAGLAAACAAGFAAVRFGWPDANERLLRDLPVLENLEAYRQTPNVEFLRAVDFFADGGEPPAVPEDLRRRRVFVERMTPEQKEQLWRRNERFRALSSAEQARLRSLAGRVDDDPESARLRQVVAGYQRWLERLSSAERAELVSLNSDERLQQIARRRAEEALRLDADDVQAFAQWFEALLVKQRPQLAAMLAPVEHEAERKAQIRRIVESNFVRGETRRAAALATPGMQRPPWRAEDLAKLRLALSEKARRQLDEAAAPPERRKLLVGWLRQAYWRGAGGPGLELSPVLSEERLRKFFDEELDASQRARLLSLPSDQMQRQLRQQYWQRHPTGKAAPGASDHAR
jgi:hypothetical protein